MGAQKNKKRHNLERVRAREAHRSTDGRQLFPTLDPGRTLSAEERAAVAARMGMRAR